QEPQLARAPVSLAARYRLDAVLLDPEELVRGGRRGARNCAAHHHFPPLALPSSGSWRSAVPPSPPPRSSRGFPDDCTTGRRELRSLAATLGAAMYPAPRRPGIPVPALRLHRP